MKISVPLCWSDHTWWSMRDSLWKSIRRNEPS